MILINKNYKPHDPYDAKCFCVGDILDASFQYSCKIAKFFKITRRTQSTIWAVRLGSTDVRGDGQNGACVPNEDSIDSKEFSGRITKYGSVYIDGSIAKLWDGNPVDFWTD